VRPSLTFWFRTAILGIVLYALVTPRIYSGPGVRPTVALADIKGRIKTALAVYKNDNGTFPKSLQDLVQQPSNTTNWRGPYLDKLPVDPWGNVYNYACPGRHNTNSFDLMSIGPDGKAGTEDDICNWAK
jgi:general secretion pathway protein G